MVVRADLVRPRERRRLPRVARAREVPREEARAERRRGREEDRAGDDAADGHVDEHGPPRARARRVGPGCADERGGDGECGHAGGIVICV